MSAKGQINLGTTSEAVFLELSLPPEIDTSMVRVIRIDLSPDDADRFAERIKDLANRVRNRRLS